VCSEEALWSAVRRWAQRHSEQQSAPASGWGELVRKLSDCFRFNEMHPEFFVEEVIGSAVLTNEEIINIQLHM
tara:strand:+ start:367 stop:585 length:219 start_codon:yes stop_codon:yes gene_type:complete